MKPQKIPDSQSNTEQMNDVDEITTPDFKIYCRNNSNKNSMILAHCRIDSVNQWDKIEDPKSNVTNYSHLILSKMPKTHTGERKYLQQIGLGFHI